MTDLSQHYPALQGGERATLEQFLDFYRVVVLDKVADLDQAQSSSYPLPATDLTVGGILKHLAYTEDRWFQMKMLGAELPDPWASAPLAEDPDWPFHSSVHDPVDTLMTLYATACERSRAAAACFDSLDAPAVAPSFGKGPVNLRWLLVHMIDETARHAGHLDLLRDAIDQR